MACNSTLQGLPNDTWNYALAATMCFITATATFENFVVLLLFYKFPMLRTPSNKILSSLATADLLTGAIVAPLHAAQYLSKDAMQNCTVEMLRRYLSTALIGASTFSVGFISYDRSLHLNKLQNYKMKKKVLYPMIGICWLVPILLPLLRYIGNTEQVYSATIITIGTIILLIIIVSYISVIVSLRNYSRKSSEHEKSAENQKRAGITVIIIITLYIAMLVPVFIYHGMNSSVSFDKNVIVKMYNLTMLFAIGNSTMNPLVYVYRTRALKRSMCQLFCNSVMDTANSTTTIEIGEIIGDI